MNFQYFESLTTGEAQEFLAAYLQVEASAWDEMKDEARRNGIDPDLTLSSVPVILKWILGSVGTVAREADNRLPSWITGTSSYLKGLFDFDEASGILVIRASYYFGAAFVKEYPTLSWSIGRADTAEVNMPVVTGFSHQLELAPIMVVENLFRRVLAGRADKNAFDVAVHYWSSKVRTKK